MHRISFMAASPSVYFPFSKVDSTFGCRGKARVFLSEVAVWLVEAALGRVAACSELKANSRAKSGKMDVSMDDPNYGQRIYDGKRGRKAPKRKCVDFNSPIMHHLHQVSAPACMTTVRFRISIVNCMIFVFALRCGNSQLISVKGL